MKQKKYNTPDKLLKETKSSLSEIINHARMLKNLEQKVLKALPPELQDHIQVINLRQGILMLGSHSASWITRLRHSNLLGTLRQSPGFHHVRSIKYKIIPKISLDNREKLTFTEEVKHEKIDNQIDELKEILKKSQK